MSIQPAGVFAESYRRDMAIFKTWKQVAALGVLLLFLITLPSTLGPQFIALGTAICISGVVAVGLQITTGYAGQINLGQSAFMGVGAFATAIFADRYGLPMILTIPIAGLAAAIFGAVFGLAAVRIKGFYLALTTIAAHAVFLFAVNNLPESWLGAAQGLTVPKAEFLGTVYDTDERIYFLTLTVLVIMVIGAYGIVRSRHGRAFVAVRDDDVAAGLIGINVRRTKATAFFIGAFYAGVGGALWAYYIRFIQVDQFSLFYSIWFVGMIIVGGLASIPGALVGVVIVRGAEHALLTYAPTLADLPLLSGDVVFSGLNLLLGGVIAIFLLLEPNGLMRRWSISKRSYRIWPFPY